MGAIFGKSKPKKPEVTEQDMAILQVKQSRDKLKQYQKKLSSQLENEIEIIKQLMAKGRKDKALLLLRKKKYTEKILVRTDNELANVENIIMDIEYKQIEMNVLQGMKVGNECLKQLNAVFSIEQIEDLLDDTNAAVEKQREINALLSGGAKNDFDEDELSRELNSIIGVAEEPQLPDVPVSSDGLEQKEEESEQNEDVEADEEGEEKIKQNKTKRKQQDERVALEA